MSVKIGREIVIYDDKVFRVGYGDPDNPEIGMIRYNDNIHDFEFFIRDQWVRSGFVVDPLYNMIRYNESLGDFEFLVEGEWKARCSCPCPDPEPCEPCPPLPPCPDPEPCPACPESMHGPPAMIRNQILNSCGSWKYCEGSSGITDDVWDLSNIPIGSKIDFMFESFIIPDRFIVEYPMGNLIYDSGWRSSDPHHDMIDLSLYNSGVFGPGTERVDNIAVRNTQTKLKVITHGSVSPLVEWRYGLRCHNDLG